jgi:FkbM family methyltransferase
MEEISDQRPGTLGKAARHLRAQFIVPGVNELRRAAYLAFRLPQTVSLTQLGDCRFRCSTRTEFFRTVRYGGEMPALAAFLFLLKSDDIVWDIGASVGVYGIHAASRCASVVCFEPDPSVATRLKENIELNGFAGRITVRGCALGSKPGVLKLLTLGLEGFAPRLTSGTASPAGATVEVPVETIDQLVSQGASRPTVLKIDIEGAELSALQGGATLLRGPGAPRLIFMEVHPQFLGDFGHSVGALLELLHVSGYAVLEGQRRDNEFHLIAFKKDA